MGNAEQKARDLLRFVVVGPTGCSLVGTLAALGKVRRRVLDVVI